jgi:hypothetical protein
MVEVDGNQLDDGSFEATFVEELDDPADGDDPDDDDEGEEEEAVLICHVPPGNPDHARAKLVDEPSVDAHMGHGDYLGECVENPVDEGGDDGDQEDDGEEDDDDNGTKVLVCHIPPGNPDNARTLSVDEEDLTDHLDHGDFEGTCEDGPGDSGDVGQEDDGDDSADDEEDEDGVKALICHIPPGNPDNARSLWVDEDDVTDHLEHGDYEGDCGSQPPDDDLSGDDGQQDDEDDGDDASEKEAVCHAPPGNPDNAKTKWVDSEDVQDHLDHGDTLGECGESDGG